MTRYPLHAQVSLVLGRQEKDFLAAYRAHMFTVQKELHEMREKIRRNETTENKSEKIKKLEDERDWYRKEALRLDAFTTSMSKDLKAMREKLEAIEGDRDWLEKQLKACKKQNKLLRAEVDAQLASGSGNAFNFDGGSTLPPFEAGSATRPNMTGSMKGQLQQSSQGGADGLPYLTLEGITQSPTIAEEREEKIKKKLRQLKRELQQKTHELTIMRLQQTQNGGLGEPGGGARSQLETLFLQCIESVKEEVARRKNGDVPNGAPDRTGKSVNRLQTRLALPNATRARNQRADGGADVNDFTSSDRVRLIERLLAHNEVLTLLYSQLFPPDNVQKTNDRADEFASGSRPTSPTLHSSDSLLNTSAAAVILSGRANDGGMHNGDNGYESNTTPRALTPVGSGAAAASAVRGSGLPIDNFTKEYLRSM